MKVICISGKAGSGKDTFAGFLKQALCDKGYKVLIAHNADLLKYICKTFFSWDGNKDERGRELLQHVGTDVIRAKQPDTWVNFIHMILKFFPSEWDFVLIPDVRFMNEISILSEDENLDVYTVRINRCRFVSKLTNEQKNHPSETELDDYPFDYYVKNVAGLETLASSAETVATDIIKTGE